MGEGELEGQAEEPARGREMARDAKERARQLRAQAELAWSRVQRVVRPERAPAPSVRSVLRAIDRVPAESYVGGIGGSLIVAGWLYAAGRRTSALNVGVWGSILFALGLAARLLRRPVRKTSERQPRRARKA